MMYPALLGTPLEQSAYATDIVNPLKYYFFPKNRTVKEVIAK